MQIRVVVMGRGYDATASLPERIELPDGADVREALTVLGRHLPADFRWPPSCMVAVSGQHLGTVGNCPDRKLSPGDELLLLAPVAGG